MYITTRFCALCSVLVAALFLNAMNVDAQAFNYAFYPTDATINTAISKPNTVFGYPDYNSYLANKNGSSPTISIAPGASLNGIYSYYHSAVNVSGGTANLLDAYNTNIVTLSGGNINTLQSYMSSTIIISANGIIASSLQIYDQSIANILGGSVNGEIRADGTVNISGGNINASLQDYNGIINVYGTNLTSTFQFYDVSHNSIYSVSGILQDNTPFNNITAIVGASGRLNLINSSSNVPEPSTYVMCLSLCLSGGALLLRRRARNCRCMTI